MPVYHLAQHQITPLPETGFAACGVKERGDLQRLLRANVSVVAPEVLVIAEEFGEWDESKRRIDLLGVDTAGNLVVIELKRDDDAHMELQAIRYAAMVSGMTFEKACNVLESYLKSRGMVGSGDLILLKHLGWDAPREEEFAQDVRIVLVSGSFSKELTTAVLWLNERDLDIRCVRMKPYTMQGDNGTRAIIVDVQQVVPLPEAQDYTIQIKAKEQAKRHDKAEREVLRRAFWTEFLPVAGLATPRFAGKTPGETHYIAATSGHPGIRWVYCVWQNQAGVELYIDTNDETQNKAIFDALHARKAEIETAHGGPLGWERLDDKRASRVFDDTVEGGIRSLRDRWPAIQKGMIEVMKRFEGAVGPWLAKAAVVSG